MSLVFVALLEAIENDNSLSKSEWRDSSPKGFPQITLWVKLEIMPKRRFELPPHC